MYSLFEGLKESEVAQIEESARVEAVARGGSLLGGEEANSLYLLKSGHVEIRKKAGEEEELLRTVKPGDFFGQMSMVRGEAAAYTAAALEDSTILCFDERAVATMFGRFPQVAGNVVRALSQKLTYSDSGRSSEGPQQSDAQKELSRLNALIEAVRTVNSSIEIGRVLELILQETVRITSAERGTIYLVDESRGEIWARIIVGDEISEIRQEIGEGISGYVAQTGETVNIRDAYVDPRFNPDFDKISGFRTKSILCMPMRNKDAKVIGVFQLINKNDGKIAFDVEDEEFLTAFSMHASIAIENSRMAQEMVNSERLSAIGRMAGTVVHDIKNPMSTIRVYAQVLKKKAGTEEASGLVDEIIRQIDRLVNMAQEVLDFSRGVSQMNVQKVKYAEFLPGVLCFIQKDLEKRNIELVKENCYDGEVEIDADKMTRVILNIAGNAADAMPNGGKFIVRSYGAGQTLVIELEDSGTGMPEEVRQRIFEPFVTYGKKHGTGLGMAIVKKIIDDHKGSIEIESEMGKGSKMTLRLPIVQTR